MTAFPDEADLSKGYVLAFRRAWENPAFLNLRDAAIWQYLFQNAVHEPEGRVVPFNGRKVQLRRGQFITSIRYLAEGFRVSEKVIRRALGGIEEGGLATLQRTHAGTLISIVKYDTYQPLAKAEGTPKGTARAHRGHTEGTNTNQCNKEESKYVGVTTNVPEPVASGEREGQRHREPRGWPPKTNHPDQLDLISDTALAAEQGEAVGIDAEPEPEMEEPVKLQAPAPAKPAQAAPLPLELSLEGEVMAAGDLMPALPPDKSAEVIPYRSGRKTKTTGDAGFDEFYEAYPRHEDPAAAHAAYRAALKKPGVCHELLMAKVAEYCAWLERNPDQQDFVKYPATWLRKGSYASELKDRQGANHGQRYQHFGKQHGPISAERNREARQRGVSNGILEAMATGRAFAGR